MNRLALACNLLEVETMKTLRQDIVFGFRVLKGSPGVTLVAILTLALGIAVNTTVFSWIDSTLLHPYAGVKNASDLALLETVTSSGERLAATSYLDYRDYRDNLKLISEIAVARFTPLSVGADGRTDRAWAELVSANYFDLLRVKPVLGRGFLPEESGDKPGAFPVAVISYKMWQERFGGDPSVLGRKIRLNRNELTIVGVAPREFNGSTVGLRYDVWMPITMAPAMGTGGSTLSFRGCRDLTSTLVRLKPGATIEQARAEAAALARRLAGMYPATNRGVDADLVPVWAGKLGAQSLLLKPLQILMAVSLLLLLIVCANVANLLLARAVSRQREFGVRLALGAHRSRLVRQLLTETLLLALAGGALGVALTLWMGRALTFLLPPNTNLPIAISRELSIPTLAFTLLVSLVATVISGTAPSLLSARADLNEVLKEGGRGGSAGAQSHRMRGLLVTAEVALATVALVGAGLFFRSFRNASGIQPGFETHNISVSRFYLSCAGYSAQEQRQFCRKLRERLEAVPGVTAVSYSDAVPLSELLGSTTTHELQVEGYVPAPSEQMRVHYSTAPPGYFNLMGIPFRDGRDFTELDEAGKPGVVIINETFARRFFRGANPIGRKVRVGSTLTTVVGLVSDSKYHTPMEAPTPFFYVPFQQWFAPGLNFAFLIKSAGDPMRLAPTLRREALALNQDAVFTTMPLTEAVTTSLYPQKVAASLMCVVGVVSLLLAAVGLYSVMSYAVSQRTHELGIRMALGAQPTDVLWLVGRQTLAWTLPGLIAGIGASLAASHLVSNMLVNMSAMDPTTFAGAAAFLGLVALVAGYVPARKATRLDPTAALRCE